MIPRHSRCTIVSCLSDLLYDGKIQILVEFVSEFLLGDNIISAPVTKENVRARDIYLPKGDWVDGNTGTAHTGPKWIRKYSVPLKTLPYFVRKGT